MASEETERDLISALAALEDTRGEMLRTVDGMEHLQVKLNRAGLNVDEIADMTARGGDWSSDPDFSRLILEQVRADSREVGTSLADLGITQEEVGRHLDASSEHLIRAREALSSATARADYGPAPEATKEAVREVHNLVSSASSRVTAARTSLRHVDVSVAAGQAYLSGPVTSPESARSLATGAQLHVSEAVTAATRSLDALDDGRDRTTRSAREIDAMADDMSRRPSASAAEQAALDDLGSGPTRSASRSRDEPRRDPGPPSTGMSL